MTNMQGFRLPKLSSSLKCRYGHATCCSFVTQKHLTRLFMNQPTRLINSGHSTDTTSHLFKVLRKFKALESNSCLLSYNKLMRIYADHHSGPFMLNTHTRHTATLTPSQNVSLSHVKRVLSSKRMEFKDGYTCVTTNCVTCNNAGGEAHLYINKTTGHFFCSHCKASGPWDSLEKSLNSNQPYSPANDILQLPQKWISISEKSKPFASLSLEKKEAMIKSFRFKRGYEGVLVKLGTLANEDATHLYVPIKNGDHIVGVKELTAGGETTVPALGCKGLIRVEDSRKKKKGEEWAVVVHSVRDLLALAAATRDCDVVCLPHGGESLPQETLPLLERYARLVVWPAGGDTPRAPITRKLDEARCYVVRWECGAEEAAGGGVDLGAVLGERVVAVRHDAIVRFSHLRDTVLSELRNQDKVAGVKWARFPTLTRLLGGHRRGEMTVLTGPSGAGKTTFVSEYSLDLAAQGVATLWGSFEVKNARLARIMLQQFSRTPLDRCLDSFDRWADRFQALPLYFMTFHGQQPLSTVMQALDHAAYVYDVAHVVIDNVQFMMGQEQDSNSLDRFFRQDAIIGAFRSFATLADCHVTLVIHPRKEREGEALSLNSVFGGAKATQEADNVLIIQHKTLPNLRIKKTLQVAKNRFSGDLGIMPLDFDKDSLSFAQDKGQP